MIRNRTLRDLLNLRRAQGENRNGDRDQERERARNRSQADAPVCAQCDRACIPLVFGLPGPRLMEEAQRGAVALGGCILPDFPPKWSCPQCHAMYYDGGRPYVDNDF